MDFKKLGLVDYPKIIRNPIDLTTIKKKIYYNKYSHLNDFLNEIQLIWDNCKLYN